MAKDGNSNDLLEIVAACESLWVQETANKVQSEELKSGGTVLESEPRTDLGVHGKLLKEYGIHPKTNRKSLKQFSKFIY